MATSGDELLSINELARAWGTGLTTIVALIQSGQLPSLDRGLLTAEGAYDVPMIRRSWSERLRRDSPAASRTLAPPPEGPFHPAFETAFNFHKAFDLNDGNGMFAASSAASREGRSPSDLLAAWESAAPHLRQQDAGVGTTIYSLAPIDAVAARVIADAPALPRAAFRPTPVTLLDALPLVYEGAEWRVDLPLFERREEWFHLLTSPLPDASEPAEGGSSPD